MLIKLFRLSNLEPVSPSQTHWVVYQLAPRIKNGEPLAIADARRDADFVQDSGLGEDRRAACAIQEGLASGANSHFTFGHYEQAIGHFHRHLGDHLEKLRSTLAKPNCPSACIVAGNEEQRT